MDMEAALWSDLPDSVLLSIQALLPVSSFLRVRSVCKRWNSLIHDGQFRTAREKTSHAPFHQEFIQQVRERPKFQNMSIVDCHEGFVLMTDFESLEILMVEPSLGFVRQIPQLCRVLCSKSSPGYTLGIVSDPGSIRYDVFLALSQAKIRLLGTKLQPMFVYRYSSELGTWRYLGSVFPRSLEKCPMLAGVVVHRGIYYLLVQSTTKLWQPYFCRVVSFEESTQTWVNLPGGFTPFEYKSPLLFTHAGRLLLAILYTDGCYIWEYQDQAATWVLSDEVKKASFTPEEVARMTEGVADGPGLVSRTKDVRQQVEKALYLHIDGDSLLFGRWGEEDRDVPFLAMRYDLVNRIWDEMPFEEVERALISRPKNQGRFFYHEKRIR